MRARAPPLPAATFALLLPVALAVLAAPAAAQASPATPTFDPVGVVGQVATPAFVLTLLVVMAAGAVGGIVFELMMLQGNIELPHKTSEDEALEGVHALPRHMYDLGIVARVLIGAMAAVAALLVLAPPNAFALLATSLLAGSAGISLFRSMQDRMLATVAQKKVTDMQAQLQNDRDKLKLVMDVVGGPAGGPGAPGAAGAGAGAGPGPSPGHPTHVPAPATGALRATLLGTGELTRIQGLLHEVKASQEMLMAKK